jgi:hypothetical protein
MKHTILGKSGLEVSRIASELSQGFSALSDPVRLRVLSMLAASPEGEVCVCEFVEPSAEPTDHLASHEDPQRGGARPWRPAG